VELKVKSYCYCRSAPLLLAALLSAGVLMVPAAAALSKNADAIPPPIEALYGSASYKAAAEYIATVPDNSELPSHSSTYEYLGKLYEHRQQPDLAVEQYKAALALDSQNKVSHDALKRLQKNKLDSPR
jgi:tetratricopeptide (TPR) repeat protein